MCDPAVCDVDGRISLRPAHRTPDREPAGLLWLPLGESGSRGSCVCVSPFLRVTVTSLDLLPLLQLLFIQRESEPKIRLLFSFKRGHMSDVIFNIVIYAVLSPLLK